MPCRLIRSEAKVDSPDVTVVAEFRRRQNAKAPVPEMGRWARDRRWLADWEVAWSAAGPRWTNAFGLWGHRERRTMTAVPPESLDTKGVRSLEVRWILPGQLTAAAADWFRRFPAETRVVEDAYLLDPHLPGLSVKVRGGRALEVRDASGAVLRAIDGPALAALALQIGLGIPPTPARKGEE